MFRREVVSIFPFVFVTKKKAALYKDGLDADDSLLEM
jgi:hypothetical protein